MKKRILKIVLLAVSVLVAIALYGQFSVEARFIDRAFQQMSGGEGTEYAETYELASGESYTVILEHACCSGAGFAAVAIQTSTGEQFSSKRNYCGIEEFGSIVRAEEFKSLADVRGGERRGISGALREKIGSRAGKLLPTLRIDSHAV